MAKISFAFVPAIFLGALVGCGADENSPEMGAVAPKPNPDVVRQMPPELQQQMKNAESGLQRQAQEMGDNPTNKK
jgi:hypothetical protein